MNNLSKSLPTAISGFVVVVGLILVGAFLVGTRQFMYLFERVEEQEVGVQFRSGSIYNLVGPGVYSDFGLFVEMRRVSSQAIPFSVRDEEIITSDKQRIGLVVAGDAFRPNFSQKEEIQRLWAQYSGIFVNDDLARDRVETLTRQAMKVCVGERKFDDAIIGTARDELRACIDDELSKLASNFGLQIENVVVPEVVLSPEVQAALDAIVQSRLATEKAAQDKLRADAQASAEQAKQEGEVRVAQARIQEEARQQILLAKLEQEKTLAQKVVIEAQKANELAQVEGQKLIIQAQKANELLAAQQDLEINRALALASAEKASAELAREVALANIYANNPNYVRLRTVEINANALRNTDKVIFTPEGAMPTIVLPGPGIVPTVNTGP